MLWPEALSCRTVLLLGVMTFTGCAGESRLSAPPTLMTRDLILHQQSVGTHLTQQRDRIGASGIIKHSFNFPVAPSDDLIDIQIALMKAPRVITGDTVHLAKHTLTEAFEHERMQTPQNLPVGYRHRA